MKINILLISLVLFFGCSPSPVVKDIYSDKEFNSLVFSKSIVNVYEPITIIHAKNSAGLIREKLPVIIKNKLSNSFQELSINISKGNLPKYFQGLRIDSRKKEFDKFMKRQKADYLIIVKQVELKKSISFYSNEPAFGNRDLRSAKDREAPMKRTNGSILIEIWSSNLKKMVFQCEIDLKSNLSDNTKDKITPLEISIEKFIEQLLKI
ncbi:MAG: hypothetical protein PVH88_17410 [Ignavibacteria bacterium]|jgi:hypothetical protein